MRINILGLMFFWLVGGSNKTLNINAMFFFPHLRKKDYWVAAFIYLLNFLFFLFQAIKEKHPMVVLMIVIFLF
jgi:hypothetical protein